MAVTRIRSGAHRIRCWLLGIERDGIALAFACRHRRTPLATKALCIFALAYALNPTDLYPESIPMLGFIDLILVPGFIWLTIKLLPSDVLTECRGQAAAWMEDKGKWRVRLGMALLVVVWAVASFAMSQLLRSP